MTNSLFVTPAYPFAPSRSWRMALFAVTFLAFAAGWMMGAPGGSAAALPPVGSELALLLRFMAGLKALFALAVVLLVTWRFGHPVTSAPAWFYLGASALMSAAPGLIWNLNHVAAGALTFHAGFLLFLGTAWRDRSKPATRTLTWFTRPRDSTVRSGHPIPHRAN